MDDLQREIDDLCAMEIRNGKDLLQELQNRYTRDKIHTFAGDVLLVINPFKRLPSAKPVPRPRGEWWYPAPAHISSVAERAFRAMCRTNKSQCCITTGVSGSGKTESSKSLVRHVLSLSTASNGVITERILQIEPILEAFGNASTPLNRNSSRFCKYFELLYNADHRLVGGQLFHYMLEKTRVTFQEKGEKNFHVFYYLLYGAEDEMLHQFCLNPSVGYRFMCSDLQPRIDASEATESKKMLHNLVHSMATLGMDALEINKILRSVATILHLGEIQFAAEPFSGSTVITNKEEVEHVSSLLAIAPQQLEMILLTNSVVAGESMHVTSCKTVQQGTAARNAIAQTLYSNLFNLIVWRINQFLLPQENHIRTPEELQIDFVDIFGFQELQTNSLEQFCVNMANEQLTYFYNQYVFAWEQHEFRNEGIRLKPVKFVDNTKVVDLLMNKEHGLLSLLDEDTRSYKGGDSALLKKFFSNHKKNPDYSAPKTVQGKTFTVQHYAGAVTYEASQFLFKNRFSLSSSIMHCMKGSRDPFIQMLFQARISRTGSFGQPQHRNAKQDALSNTRNRKKKKKLSGTVRRKASVVDHLANDSNTSNQITTVGSIFRNSLSVIMEKILKSTCYFVRCIKPNQSQFPGYLDEKFIMSQLRHCEVLETILIRRVGYSVRLSFANFIERYRMLSYPLLAAVKETAGSCQAILTGSRQASAGWTIGKTKVLLKYWCVSNLDTLVDRALHGIVSLQKVFRGRQTRIALARTRYQQRLERQFVGNFLAQIIDQGGLTHKSLSLQIDEDDAREKTKRNLKAAVPAPDRQPMMQQNVTGSSKVTDDRGPPTHSLQQRDSNLSVTSVESVLSTISVEEDDVDAAPSAWCQVTYYERELQKAEFTIDRPSFVIDGSNNTFDATRIGLGALSTSGDSIVTKVRSCVQKGVKIFHDDEFNVWVQRLSKNPVFVKGHHVGADLREAKGELPRKKAMMIFDYNAFVHRLQSDCSVQTFTSEREAKILSNVCVYVSFVAEGNVDSETPCWVQLVVLQAKRQAQGSIMAARHGRTQLQKKDYEKIAAVSKNNVGRTRQAAAVNALSKQIRPKRRIDTFRFGRKNWARKKAVTDPFSFGKEDKVLRRLPQDTAKGNDVSKPTVPRDEDLEMSGNQKSWAKTKQRNKNIKSIKKKKAKTSI